MQLIGQYDSPFVRRVGIALARYGVAFEHLPWSTFGDWQKFAHQNPLRRVPCLVLDSGEALIDSAAILDHLDEVHGRESALIAASGPERRAALRRIALATGTADKAVSFFYARLFASSLDSAFVERSEAQIRAGLAALEAEVIARETSLATLQTDLRTFESRYLSIVGGRYNELAEIEREIAKLQGLDFDDDAETTSLAEDEVGCGQNRFHADKLKKLYREVARKFHPDLAQCAQERMHRHQLMVEVNRAYEAGAEDRLQELLEAGQGLESVETDGALSAEMILLVRQIAEAKQKLAGLAADADEITASEIYKLKLRVENAESLGIDLLADLVSQVDRQIKKAQNRLEHLRGLELAL